MIKALIFIFLHCACTALRVRFENLRQQTFRLPKKNPSSERCDDHGLIECLNYPKIKIYLIKNLADRVSSLLLQALRQVRLVCYSNTAELISKLVFAYFVQKILINQVVLVRNGKKGLAVHRFSFGRFPVAYQDENQLNGILQNIKIPNSTSFF